MCYRSVRTSDRIQTDGSSLKNKMRRSTSVTRGRTLELQSILDDKQRSIDKAERATLHTYLFGAEYSLLFSFDLVLWPWFGQFEASAQHLRLPELHSIPLVSIRRILSVAYTHKPCHSKLNSPPFPYPRKHTQSTPRHRSHNISKLSIWTNQIHSIICALTALASRNWRP